jgi:hypothetical protein
MFTDSRGIRGENEEDHEEREEHGEYTRKQTRYNSQSLTPAATGPI